MKQTVLIQRIEAAFVLAASILLYLHLGYNIVWFVVLLLAIDIVMVGYLFNNRVGAYVYNFGHSLIIPSTLLVLWIISANSSLLALGLIWVAHIGMDRAFGYGLKHESGFTVTHLGRIGKHKV